MSSTTRTPFSGGSMAEFMALPLVLAGFGRPARWQQLGIEHEGTAVVGQPDPAEPGQVSRQVVCAAEVEFRAQRHLGIGGAERTGEARVLARFEPEEAPGVDEAIARAADAAEMWVSEGVAKAMNTFNRAVDRANVQP